ncbi:MAG: hypothetical protein Q9P14_01320 [candidate division KSB1 bacterium]|nr:hypothetical protein [candidate division KSB1 bacterium]
MHAAGAHRWKIRADEKQVFLFSGHDFVFDRNCKKGAGFKKTVQALQDSQRIKPLAGALSSLTLFEKSGKKLKHAGEYFKNGF